MNLEFSNQLPEDFSDASKVWVYQCNRLFLLSEALEIEEMLENFVTGWKSHGVPVKAYANLFFGRFIVLIADETSCAVGGCSTDESIRLIKDIEQKMNVSLLDRQNLAFALKDKIEILPLSQINYAVENGFITPDTLYFNNTVLNKKELKENWLIPVKHSWLSKRIAFPELS